MTQNAIFIWSHLLQTDPRDWPLWQYSAKSVSERQFGCFYFPTFSPKIVCFCSKAQSPFFSHLSRFTIVFVSKFSLSVHNRNTSSCILIDLGRDLVIPPTLFSQQLEYEFLSEFFNSLPTFKLVFSQINEMDNAIDPVPLKGGHFEEGTFRTVQEKMTILIQLQLTFQAAIDPICDCKSD